MAKKNVRDEPLKPQVSENEQMSDIVFILDKMELILQAVSKIGKDGKYSTVPADKEHSNSFLKNPHLYPFSHACHVPHRHPESDGFTDRDFGKRTSEPYHALHFPQHSEVEAHGR